MNPQQLAFAWCKMRQMFNEPVNHRMLAVIFHESHDCAPSWEYCLSMAANLVAEWHACEHEESAHNRGLPQPPAEMLAAIQSYYA